MAISFWKRLANVTGVSFGRKVFLTEPSRVLNNEITVTLNQMVWAGITSLPSSHLVKKTQNSNEMNPNFYDMTPTLLSLPFQYSKNHWKCGHLFLFINYAQIVVMSYLELAFRAAGILLTATAGKFIPRKDDETWLKAIKVVFSPLTLILGTAFWSLGQTFSFVADTVSHTRALIDSVLQLPILFTAKLFGVTEGIPSFKYTAKILGLSLLKLLPAAAIIAAGILTGGAAVPVAQSGSTLLANSIAIASTPVATVATATTTLIMTAATVALVTASKLWSSFWTTVDVYFRDRELAKPQKKPLERTIVKATVKATLFGCIPASTSTRKIAADAHFRAGAALAPPAENNTLPTENSRRSSGADLTQNTTNTHENGPEPIRVRSNTIVLK